MTTRMVIAMSFACCAVTVVPWRSIESILPGETAAIFSGSATRLVDCANSLPVRPRIVLNARRVRGFSMIVSAIVSSDTSVKAPVALLAAAYAL